MSDRDARESGDTSKRVGSGVRAGVPDASGGTRSDAASGPSSSADPGDAGALAALRFHAPEAYDHYGSNTYLQERNRILLEVLPETARTVLDVGCGPGIVGHAIASTGRTVVSTDLSRAALEARPPLPYLASATHLPHRDRSFDLVLSLEMLEHIPDEVLRPIANEMARIAGEWLLVGVPHRENLARNFLLCPRCGLRFNRTGHVQSFDRDRLAGLFPDFRLEWSHICGPPVRDYPDTLLHLRHDIAHRFSEMASRGGNVCPRCHETEFAPFRHNLLSFALDGINKVISKRRPYWILELLRRG
ncbi:MAG: methyltransferase domain-containing protein [Candidatus Eisenbacteria bacterium]|uniref:Methyltransferase domain-containing protein n=1 Tax=Eiseniibacteriota bacterium TaxID=2212470 RepID=A0A956SDD6_UNCEI|nr:methyltransferase domain-containing protein [Candidatus Eisenbacteria bacterium]